MKLHSILFACVIALPIPASAANIPFDLQGTAGAGLLFGNEPAVASGGTGGEVGAGVFFDNVAMTITVNVAWGSLNGFTDLTGAATASHIHGPTPSVGGAGFTETTNVLFTLPRVSSTANGGSIATTTVPLSAAQVTDLFNTKYYVNVHTAVNGSGEIRGFLVAVPEPSVLTLAGLGLCVLGYILRRKH